MRLVEPALLRNPWETAIWRWGPSPHLTWRELDCNDTEKTPYPEEWRLERAYPLSVEYEYIRATMGGFPFRVGSGYRTWGWNTRVGGARYSQHPEGKALDIYPPMEGRLPLLLDAVMLVAHRPGGKIRGVGVYRTFIHIDIRSAGRICRWRGSRVAAEVWNKTLEDTYDRQN